jgi:hypothetical protein
MILFGTFIAAVGGLIWDECTSVPAGQGMAADCGGGILFTVFGLIFLLLGIGILIAVIFHPTVTIGQPAGIERSPHAIRPVVVERTVVQQTVEVRCRYCGSLNYETATDCVSCGAPL